MMLVVKECTLVEEQRKPPIAQKPLELILARNLLTSITTPAFLVDNDAALLFYNEAAGALLGIPFEELGRMDPAVWTSKFGPVAGSNGEPIDIEALPLTIALRDGRPAHANLTIRSSDGEPHEIAASAMPMVGAAEGASGAIVIFWPVDEDHARMVATGRHEVTG